jgi:hypothetical protein
MRLARPIAKRVAYRTLGPRRARRLAEIILDTGSYLSYRLDARGRQSRRRLAGLRDRHRGRRCFILGNGPSLQRTDLSPLRSELTFGLNRAYLMFERNGFATTYLASVNRLVIEQSGSEILESPVDEVFVGWDARDAIERSDRPIYVRSLARPCFSTQAGNGVWEGATVTYVALQLAYHMGIRDVVLLGVDHRFSSTGSPHQVVTSSGPDRDHFSPGYFGPGYRWQLPDLETSEVAYRLARAAFERAGGRVRDATLDGHLDVFPKVTYESLFTGAR